MRFAALSVAFTSSLFVAPAAAAPDGQVAYGRYCAACHGRSGQGAPGLAPPLTSAPAMARSVEGRAYLAAVVASGVAGPIRVDGRAYAGVMARPGGSAEERASILNYLTRADGKRTPMFQASHLQGEAARLAPAAVARRRPADR